MRWTPGRQERDDDSPHEIAPQRALHDFLGAPVTIDVQVDDRGSTGREPDPSDLLVVDNLTVTFPTDDGLVKAVRGVSYTVRAGDSLGIVGESGSAKSVSSMAVMGLLPKNARLTGSIKFRGRELIGLSEKE